MLSCMETKRLLLLLLERDDQPPPRTTTTAATATPRGWIEMVGAATWWWWCGDFAFLFLPLSLLSALFSSLYQLAGSIPMNRFLLLLYGGRCVGGEEVEVLVAGKRLKMLVVVVVVVILRADKQGILTEPVGTSIVRRAPVGQRTKFCNQRTTHPTTRDNHHHDNDIQNQSTKLPS